MTAIFLCLCGFGCLGGENTETGAHHRGAEISPSQRERLLLRSALVLLLILMFAISLPAQNQTKRNDRPLSDALSPRAEKKESEATRYTWEFAQSQFTINHIVIEHDALGRGKVSFERKGEEMSIVEPVELSQKALERIRNLWVALRFLDSHENYQSSRNFAHLGTYKLGMDNGTRQRTAEFNWSNNADAWGLAQEYRRVADQAIFIFDITVARENQPLNTPGLLNQLESMYNRNWLSDPKQLVPLLKELRTDEHIPLIARNHADRLLKKIEK